jgi:GNAT superfamily N-acetyltransferase
MLADAAHGRFPEFDGLVEVMPSPGGRCAAVVGFTGHCVLAADIDPRLAASRWAAGELGAPFRPDSIVWIADLLGRKPWTFDALLVTIADGSGAPPWLRPDDDASHPRVEEASHYRTIEGVWTTEDGAGVLNVGRGLCDRWEVGYEIAPEHRSAGLGRRLVAAARGLVPAGEPLWAQVMPGNAASMRSTLAAGFNPVACEVLFTEEPNG